MWEAWLAAPGVAMVAGGICRRCLWSAGAILTPLAIPANFPGEIHPHTRRNYILRSRRLKPTGSVRCRNFLRINLAGRRWLRRWRGSTTVCRRTYAIRTAIFAQNYGQAGAIDLFGLQYGLPAAVSGHQSYFPVGAA